MTEKTTKQDDLSLYLPNTEESNEFCILVEDYKIPYTVVTNEVWFTSTDLHNAAKNIWRKATNREPSQGFYSFNYFITRLGKTPEDLSKVKTTGASARFASCYSRQNGYKLTKVNVKKGMNICGWKTAYRYLKTVLARASGSVSISDPAVSKNPKRHEESVSHNNTTSNKHGATKVNWEVSPGFLRNMTHVTPEDVREDSIINLRIEQLELEKRLKSTYSKLKSQINSLDLEE